MFSEEELTYLNCETRLLALKNDATLSEAQRYERAQQHLHAWAQKQRPSQALEALYLSSAAKLIVAVYLSKFSRQQRLWGTVKEEVNSSPLPASKAPSVTPLYDAQSQPAHSRQALQQFPASSSQASSSDGVKYEDYEAEVTNISSTQGIKAKFNRGKNKKINIGPANRFPQ